MLAFEMAQDVLQPFLDPSEIAGSRGSVGGFQTLQQIRYALFEMGKCRRIVVADRHAVEAFGQRAQCAFEMFGIVADAGRSRLSSVEVSAAMRCSSMAKESPWLSRARKLVDLGRQRVHVVGQPRQRVVGGDVGDDRAKRGDRAFELLNRRGIVIGAQDQIELGAEIADRLVIAGELLGRRQRAQHLADFAERAFDAGQRLAVAAVLAGVVDAAGQRADFVLDRFDRPARHRLGDGGTYFGELAAECRNRLLDVVGTLQRLDLARDLDQMTFQRGEIRTGGRCRCHRRRCIGCNRRSGRRNRRCARRRLRHRAAMIGAATCAAAAGHRVRSGARRFPRSRNRSDAGLSGGEGR